MRPAVPATQRQSRSSREPPHVLEGRIVVIGFLDRGIIYDPAKISRLARMNGLLIDPGDPYHLGTPFIGPRGCRLGQGSLSRCRPAAPPRYEKPACAIYSAIPIEYISTAGAMKVLMSAR